MIICNPRSLASALLIAALPMGFALAADGGVRGGGVGAAVMGRVGGGPPAGSDGRGPSAGAVGGGSLGSSNAAGSGAAGTGNPSGNFGGLPGIGTNASPGITRATPPPGLLGGPSPAAFGSQLPFATDATAPNSVQDIAEEGVLAGPGQDDVSTVTVAPRPCGVAAHETDGTTTCIGIPDRSPNASRTRRR